MHCHRNPSGYIAFSPLARPKLCPYSQRTALSQSARGCAAGANFEAFRFLAHYVISLDVISLRAKFGRRAPGYLEESASQSGGLLVVVVVGLADRIEAEGHNVDVKRRRLLPVKPARLCEKAYS